jgi:hypothetical protein
MDRLPPPKLTIAIAVIKVKLDARTLLECQYIPDLFAFLMVVPLYATFAAFHIHNMNCRHPKNPVRCVCNQIPRSCSSELTISKSSTQDTRSGHLRDRLSRKSNSTTTSGDGTGRFPTHGRRPTTLGKDIGTVEKLIDSKKCRAKVCGPE